MEGTKKNIKHMGKLFNENKIKSRKIAINIIARRKEKVQESDKRKKILCFSSSHKRNDDDYCEGFFYFFLFLPPALSQTYFYLFNLLQQLKHEG